MSEKRFRAMSNESKQLYCIESVDGEMFSIQEIVDMLNSLNNENIFLAENEEEAKRIVYSFNQLWEEHEQLLQSFKNYKDSHNALEQKLILCNKENEQLRQANNTLAKNLQDEEEENAREYDALDEEYEQLKEENEQLRKKCFELKKDYLIETSGIELLNIQQDIISTLKEENEQLKEYCTMLKSQIKKMGEIGGFNKHMIKTILESNYDD